MENHAFGPRAMRKSGEPPASGLTGALRTRFGGGVFWDGLAIRGAGADRLGMGEESTGPGRGVRLVESTSRSRLCASKRVEPLDLPDR
jgi:hypothetical protein